jgi:hypothetical protein
LQVNVLTGLDFEQKATFLLIVPSQIRCFLTVIYVNMSSTFETGGGHVMVHGRLAPDWCDH